MELLFSNELIQNSLLSGKELEEFKQKGKQLFSHTQDAILEVYVYDEKVCITKVIPTISFILKGIQ